MEKNKSLFEEYVRLMVEAKLREVDVTDGKAEWGSDDHIQDLQSRIDDLIKWRDRQRKGTEARANYSRLVSRLRSELKSAQRTNQKNKPQRISREEE